MWTPRACLTSPRSPWQNPYAERLVGSIRRECLDHILVLKESSPRRILKSYLEYYLDSRTHRALDGDAPETGPVQPPELSGVVEIPELGGLHHRYERRTALTFLPTGGAPAGLLNQARFLNCPPTSQGY
jgi:putative transposase